jgi:F-type H+-transporting ATPase subunit epsilon
MQPMLMTLKILLPSGTLFEKNDVSRVVAETNIGSFGLLPHRLDCVAALIPGLLTFENELEGEKFIAVDEGVLIKTGPDINISVRNAIGGRVLGQLREAVTHEFMKSNEQERNMRRAMAKMESSFIQRLAEMRHE